MILTALCLAIGIRLSNVFWSYKMSRWQRSLIAFIVPPLLLLMTAIAVISMGYHGEMLGFHASRFSYLLSILFLGFTLIRGLEITYRGWVSTQKVKDYPQRNINNNIAKIINTKVPYSAQIGFWNSELIISSGLLETLDNEHLEAVIAHEKAHSHYHDTFWFFWLGWLKRISVLLPKTNELWQDLLLLREIRADQKAALTVDPLIVAESLLIIAQEVKKIANNKSLSVVEAGFHDIEMNNHLEERINALFGESDYFRFEGIDWHCLLFTLLPLISIPFHR